MRQQLEQPDGKPAQDSGKGTKKPAFHRLRLIDVCAL
jgi:hypothetical protein